MNAKVQAVRAIKRRPSEQRRTMIFSGLRDCIIDQGYATTTLADVARAAGMSPSHLLYYFSDKADILSQYFASVAKRIAMRLDEFRSHEPALRIDMLAHLFFSGKGLSKSEIGFMLECFGAAVHAPGLKQQKADLDRLCKSYLQELFEVLRKDAEGSANSAEAAYALLVGLRTAVYFDENLNVDQAQEIFRKEITRMVDARSNTKQTRSAARADR
jgi:AcrR family transcriptional regulator